MVMVNAVCESICGALVVEGWRLRCSPTYLPAACLDPFATTVQRYAVSLFLRIWMNTMASIMLAEQSGLYGSLCGARLVWDCVGWSCAAQLAGRGHASQPTSSIARLC